MPNVLRQLSYHLSRGNVKSAMPAEREWDFEDINDRLVLVIEEGKIIGGSRLIAANGGSFTVPLPPEYDDTKPLTCFISAYGIIRGTLVKTDSSSQKTLIQGNSDREGVAYLTDFIDSITLENPTTQDIFVRYMLFEQPDLDSSYSYRGNYVNYGVQTSNG